MLSRLQSRDLTTFMLLFCLEAFSTCTYGLHALSLRVPQSSHFPTTFQPAPTFLKSFIGSSFLPFDLHLWRFPNVLLLSLFWFKMVIELGYRYRWMYYLTGLLRWLRFGFSPGWVGRSPTGLPPTVQWMLQSGLKNVSPGNTYPASNSAHPHIQQGTREADTRTTSEDLRVAA